MGAVGDASGVWQGCRPAEWVPGGTVTLTELLRGGILEEMSEYVQISLQLLVAGLFFNSAAVTWF